jgi:hypothetical protein
MFKIDETDFGIDQAKSAFKLKISRSGDAVLDAEVYGDKQRYEEITEDSSLWSWTLNPPHFY